MTKKNIILILICYILVLLQTSFTVHFRVFGSTLNLILIAVILINLFEKPENKSGLTVAFFGGIFSDIFSVHFIGFYAAICLLISLFIKFILRRHVSISAILRK